MDRTENARKSSAAVIVVLIALLMPALYVLSIGPAVMILNHTGGAGQDLAQIFYYPIIWLHENTPLSVPLEWYIELWE